MSLRPIGLQSGDEKRDTKDIYEYLRQLVKDLDFTLYEIKHDIEQLKKALEENKHG